MRRKKFERRKKTYEEIIQLGPDDLFFNEDTGIVLRMEPAPETLWPLGELLQKFYTANEGLNPISFQFVEDRSQAIAEKNWYAIMYRGWHIRIEEGSETSGPHICQLWFKSQSMRKNFWIATLQLCAFYYNREEVLAALLQAIANREFFMSDDDRDKCITV